MIFAGAFLMVAATCVVADSAFVRFSASAASASFRRCLSSWGRGNSARVRALFFVFKRDTATFPLPTRGRWARLSPVPSRRELAREWQDFSRGVSDDD